MIRLAIALHDPERADAYRRAVRRLRHVVVVDRDSEADAVIVDDTAEACRIARSGRHILLEKAGGAGSDGPALAELAEACRTSGRQGMPAHTWRFRPSVRAVRAALEAGKLGQPGLLRIHRWEPRDAKGASVSAPTLIAEIDLASWFFGGAPREIYAVARNDYFQVHLGFAGGGMALIDHATLPTGDGYYSLSLIGSTGAAYADDHRDRQLLFTGGGPVAVGAGHDELDVLGLLDEFASAIREMRTPSVTLEATRTATDVLRGVTAAAREGCVARASGEHYELD